jgi:hypothetical protein
LKGTAKIYYKQSQYIREAHREILNYDTSASSSHYHHHPPAPHPPPPPTTTVEIHQNENSNEVSVVSPSSITDGQSPLNF